MALLFQGVSSFAQSGNARWERSVWDLDRLIVPYSGPQTAFDAFVGGLSLGSSSGIDGNLFLEDFRVDEHKQYPTVSLVYAGRKSGSLPADRKSVSSAVQTARVILYSSSGSDAGSNENSQGDQSKVGTFRIDLTYRAYSSTVDHWTRSQVDVASVSVPSPSDPVPLFFSTEWQNWPASFISIDLAGAAGYFSKVTMRTGESNEVMPGQYFKTRATDTRHFLGS